MDSQGRDPKQRSVDLDDFRRERAVLISGDDSSRKTQVPVQPRMPDASSVGFHANLEISLLASLRDWSDTEVRAIDVSCHNRDSSAGLPFSRDREGQERALISVRSDVEQPGFGVRLLTHLVKKYFPPSLISFSHSSTSRI